MPGLRGSTARATEPTRGLAIARREAQSHDGAGSAESTIGRASRLPVIARCKRLGSSLVVVISPVSVGENPAAPFARAIFELAHQNPTRAWPGTSSTRACTHSSQERNVLLEPLPGTDRKTHPVRPASSSTSPAQAQKPSPCETTRQEQHRRSQHRSRKIRRQRDGRSALDARPWSPRVRVRGTARSFWRSATLHLVNQA